MLKIFIDSLFLLTRMRLLSDVTPRRRLSEEELFLRRSLQTGPDHIDDSNAPCRSR